MNRLDTQTRSRIVRCLVEGMGVNSTSRTVGVCKNTVLRLIRDLGAACAAYQRENLVGLKVKSPQADEVWSFVHCKEKNVPEDRPGEWGIGDVWVWSCVDSDTKLIFSYRVGMRTPHDAEEFMFDVACRVEGRFQLTTDGLKAYLRAVVDSFGSEIDYAMLVKRYGNDYEGAHRYSPAVCTGCDKTPIIGNPDPAKVSTSFVERTNLTLRMGNRRFTRLTNAHSKKIENHEAALSLHLMYYNYGRKHMSLGTSPAVAAGVADHVWSIDEIVALLGN